MQPKQFFSDIVTPTQWCVLSFGIEHDDLRLAQDPRHPELAQPRVAGLERRSHERRVVEVDEPQAGVVERVAEARGERDRLRVTAMARPLGHDDRGGTEPPECVRGGHHHPRVGVDRRALDELDEVRLEQDALAPHVRLDEPEAVEHESFEVAVVAPGTKHGDGRAARASGTPRDRTWAARRTRPSDPRRMPRRRSTHRAAAPAATTSFLRVMLTRATSGARGGRPGRSRARPRRPRAASRGTRAGARSTPVRRGAPGTPSRRPWRRYATSACATVSPPGSRRQLLRGTRTPARRPAAWPCWSAIRPIAVVCA